MSTETLASEKPLGNLPLAGREEVGREEVDEVGDVVRGPSWWETPAVSICLICANSGELTLNSIHIDARTIQ